MAKGMEQLAKGMQGAQTARSWTSAAGAALEVARWKRDEQGEQ
jgi:hypothetical protein